MITSLCGTFALAFVGFHFEVTKKRRVKMSVLPSVHLFMTYFQRLIYISVKFSIEFPYKRLFVKHDFLEKSSQGHSSFAWGGTRIFAHTAYNNWPILVKFDFCLLQLSSFAFRYICGLKSLLNWRAWNFAPIFTVFLSIWMAFGTTGVLYVLAGDVKIGAAKNCCTGSVNEFMSAFVTIIVRCEWISVWHICM